MAVSAESPKPKKPYEHEAFPTTVYSSKAPAGRVVRTADELAELVTVDGPNVWFDSPKQVLVTKDAPEIDYNARLNALTEKVAELRLVNADLVAENSSLKARIARGSDYVPPPFKPTPVEHSKTSFREDTLEHAYHTSERRAEFAGPAPFTEHPAVSKEPVPAKPEDHKPNVDDKPSTEQQHKGAPSRSAGKPFEGGQPKTAPSK
jgi:hypothetical protein